MGRDPAGKRPPARPRGRRRATGPPDRADLTLLPAEVDEDPAEVLGVLLDPVVERLDLGLVEEPQDPLLELARPLAGDDLHQGRPGPDRFVDGSPQGPVDVLTPVIDVVQVQLDLHRRLRSWNPSTLPAAAG